MTTALIIIGIAAGALCLAMALSIWLARRAHAAQITGQDLPAAMELARLRQQEAAAARLAAELRRIINSQQAVCLPLEDTGSARRALANWDKAMREAQG